MGPIGKPLRVIAGCLVALTLLAAYAVLPPIDHTTWLVIFAGIVASVEVMRFFGIGPGARRVVAEIPASRDLQSSIDRQRRGGRFEEVHAPRLRSDRVEQQLTTDNQRADVEARIGIDQADRLPERSERDRT